MHDAMRAVLASRFQQHADAVDVGLHEIAGIGATVDVRFRSEVDDRVEIGDRGVNGSGVADVALDEGEAGVPV